VLEDEHATSHTTIEDALSHRSGLPRHDLIYGQPGDTPSSVVRRIRYLAMTYQPRTVYQYCNIMFGVMTDLIESLTGQTLETVLRERFWGPLGMDSTSFSLSSDNDDTGSQLARGYYWNPKSDCETASSQKGHYVPEPYLDISAISGAGSIISTVNDYSLWVKTLLDAAKNKTSSKSPITGSMINDLFHPRTIMSLPALGVHDAEALVMPPLYALGWLKVNLFEEPLVAHDGGLTGFGTNVYMFPGKKFGVITMGNTAETSNIAGSLISSLLLLRKIGRGPTNLGALTETHKVLHTASLMDLSSNWNKCSKRSVSPLSSNLSLPLPGKLSEFAGLYIHPGYGTINFTVVSVEGTEVLEAFLYPRVWPRKLQLSHTTDTVFALKLLRPHGLGDIHSDKIVWEDQGGDLQAVFKFGLDGEVVETMGVELEPEMVEMARNLGTKYWKEGMVWFQKL
jgi:hypothetical protein